MVGAVALGLLLVGVGYVAITRTLHADAGAPPTRIDVLKTALTAVAGVGGAVALVVAYRRQHDLEQGRFIERFGAATAQLGNPDPAVRIAGVYALTSAADEATTNGRRQQCIDVLCGYLRLPYAPDWGGSHHTEIVTAAKDPANAVVQTGRETTYHQKLRQNDREVRQTIMRVIAAHVGHDTAFAWSNHNFDFTGVIFEDVSLQTTTFNGEAIFNMATFTGNASFNKATFTGPTTFNDSRFTGNAHFENATFARDVQFDHVTFASDTHFNNCAFKGIAVFKDAKFRRNALFKDTSFTQAAVFTNAEFSQNAVFSSATFVREAVFNNVTFIRSAWFNNGAVFMGEAQFSSAVFKLKAQFVNASFKNNARFKLAKFEHDALFSKTTFERKAIFENVKFKGATHFKNTRFTEAPKIFDTATFRDRTEALNDAIFAGN